MFKRKNGEKLLFPERCLQLLYKYNYFWMSIKLLKHFTKTILKTLNFSPAANNLRRILPSPILNNISCKWSMLLGEKILLQTNKKIILQSSNQWVASRSYGLINTPTWLQQLDISCRMIYLSKDQIDFNFYDSI